MAFLLTADDFGASTLINQSILKAHLTGILHAASLMMGEEKTQEAVTLAKANPTLQVGLHLNLVDGKSVLPYSEIPNLVDFSRNFPRGPAYTWFKYFLNQRKLKSQLEKEVRAQFEAFRLTGLPLSHVDGHHHQHLHPTIFKLVVDLAKKHGARWIRIPRENLKIWKNCAPQPSLLKRLHGLTYYGLTLGKKLFLQRNGFYAFDGVFGFLETRCISKKYVLNVLQTNPPGNFEIYFHPGASWNHDLDVLLDPEIRRMAVSRKISSIQLEMSSA